MSTIIKKIFIKIELIIYILFMYLDIFQPSLYIISTYLKFVSIIICALYVILSFRFKARNIDRWLLLLAILFTLVSDWFILIRDNYNYGLITFIIVQHLYFIRIHRQNKNITVSFIISKLFANIVIVGCIISILVFNQVVVDSLILLSMFYFTTFIMNVLYGIYYFQKRKEASFLLFLVGIFLFLLCDINVGIFNFTSYVIIDGNWFTAIEKFSEVGMWMFYLPSQVLISLSSLSKE
jgi:hypothetical protein